MPDFRIRLARPDDAEAIAGAHIDARRVAMPWLPNLHSRADAIRYFSEVVVVDEEVYVAEVDGGVAGFIAIAGDHVDHLYVAPPYQGRGIGSLLLAKAKELRPGGLQLWTFERNTRARQFYEARGFITPQFPVASPTGD